jgi:hypothetical protein
VLAYLMRFKQICNHPSQWQRRRGTSTPRTAASSSALQELCEPIAEAGEKVLVFTQFQRDDRAAGATSHLLRRSPASCCTAARPVRARRAGRRLSEDGRPALHGALAQGRRHRAQPHRRRHVVHFDRWWNPAVENQATDRAYRIGQKRNVLVHKFVCRGTLEERIDAMLRDKQGLADGVLASTGR